jgi:hypothetical protein
LSEPVVAVRLIRAFEGPRHDRLRNIWQAIAEYSAPSIRVHWYANAGARLSHADAFSRIWLEERTRGDTQFVLFTEEDFLPSLTGGWTDWTGFSLALETESAAVVVPYHTRYENTKKIQPHRGLSGGWFVLFNRALLPPKFNPKFRGTPDPCNQLLQQLHDARLPVITLTARDCYPEHYGIEYPTGVHLFWSRHLHDPPHRRVGAFRLGDVQRKHDKAVDNWLATQPKEFQELYATRHPR